MSAEKSPVQQNQVLIEIPLTRLYLIEKRLMDIIGSLSLIIILFPLFLFIIVWIKMDDYKGTIFFFQERVGKNEKDFQMIKFRSMHSDAEKRLEGLLMYNEAEGAMFKMKNDPRITSVGRVIRRFSLDELPQLINVLKGEMSLVGPRPPLPREVEEYTGYDKQRLAVTPGLTGLWQVSGRSSLSFDQMVEMDLTYIRNCCLKQDILILLRTVKVVLKSEHAY